MSDNERTREQEMADLLKRSVQPVSRELNRDLWPAMLQRLSGPEHERNWLATLLSREALAAVPRFDWALLALLIVGVSLFPRSIPVWLYHF